MAELEALITWTPFLLGGFLWNIIIAAVAMLIGTLAGIALALARESHRAWPRRISLGVTELSRNVPTIVFQFYLAMMLPNELAIAGTSLTIAIPPWVKAALALAVAVVGFTSDNLSVALRDWRSGRHSTALMFVPAWASYMLIIVLASSTASIIGVGELVSRCNTVINATGNTALMIPIYVYAILIFFVFCYPLVYGLDRTRQHLALRYRPAALPPGQQQEHTALPARND